MRGKYASHAEATRAREDAISLLNLAEHKILRLERENAELRQILNVEREESRERTRAFSMQVEEMTSPLVESLRERVADAERRADDALHDVGIRVAKVFQSHTEDFKASMELHADLSEAMGISMAEYLRMADGNRLQRRATPAKARQIAQLERGWGAS